MFDKTFILTYKKKCFSPLNPHKSDIDINDIAHALSLMCRANGHFSEFYSVAQHCISCANEAKMRGYNTKIQLACLLHDASEAYISDITRPVKISLNEYRSIEKNLQNTIFEAFNVTLDENELALVSSVDDAMLYYEFYYYTNEKLFEDTPKIVSDPEFVFLDFKKVEENFLYIYKALNII